MSHIPPLTFPTITLPTLPTFGGSRVGVARAAGVGARPVPEPSLYERTETCILCNRTWGLHRGWACETADKQYWGKGPDEIPREHRFWTLSMRDAQAKKVRDEDEAVARGERIRLAFTVPVEKPETPEWRHWQHKAEGECPCGTNRAACVYHRDSKP